MLSAQDNVSIHALLAECDLRPVRRLIPFFVSIHALLAECDRNRYSSFCQYGGFNPRTPCGVRPASFGIFPHTSCFNPRTPCGVRLLKIILIFACKGFNPRTPCGVRQNRPYVPDARKMFQSTHSLRSATCSGAVFQRKCSVSIHALLAECDSNSGSYSSQFPRFNPRTPCGVRRRILPFRI